MIYSFDTELAAEIGLNEAILLQNIAYWVKPVLDTASYQIRAREVAESRLYQNGSV